MDLKCNTKNKAALLILIIGIVLILIVIFAAPSNNPYNNYKINSAEDIPEFLSDLGWETDVQNITQQYSMLPEQFDAVFMEYNALQLQQKCDLTKYAGKEIIIFTAPITNYGDSSNNIYATIIIHNGRIIGGDIHSADLNGFMHTLT